MVGLFQNHCKTDIEFSNLVPDELIQVFICVGIDNMDNYFNYDTLPLVSLLLPGKCKVCKMILLKYASVPQ